MSVLRGNEIYSLSDLIASYSSWIEYLNEFLRIGWTNGILCILYRLYCNDLSSREMSSITYKVSDIMNDQSFMNSYIYQIVDQSIGVGIIWGLKLAKFLA